MNKIIFVLAITALFLFSACQQKNDNRMGNTRDTTTNKTERAGVRTDISEKGIYWNENKTYSYGERHQYKKDLTSALAKLDKKIDSLEAKERVSKGDIRDKYDKAIKDMRSQRKDVKDYVDKVDKVKQNDWESFKKDVNKTWAHVDNAWNDAMKDIRNANDRNEKK